MGQVIRSDASVDLIEADVRATMRAATARGGEVQAAVEARLGPAAEALATTSATLAASSEAAETGWSVVVARDAEADLVIKRVRDEMWNALGRPKEHVAMSHVFAGGVGTYASGSLLEQPVLMGVLASRIQSAEGAPAWTPERRSTWVAEVTAARGPLEAAVTAFRPLEAARVVADAGRRAAARTAQARLVRLKQDLKDLGMTENQIHELIPDRSGGGKKRPEEPPAEG